MLESLSNKVAGLKADKFIKKKDSKAGVFVWILRNFSRKDVYIEKLSWQFLSV